MRAVRKKAKPPSAESRYIGYLVLGFGVLAVVAVAILALSGRKDAGTQNKTVEAQAQILTQAQKAAAQPQIAVEKPPMSANVATRAAQDLMQDLNGQTLAAPREQAEDGLYFPRQPKVKRENLEGTWRGVVGRYAVALKMQGGTYQIILANPDEYSRRLYSSGEYKITEDIIEFSPRRDWPAPTPPVGTDVRYQNITSSPFPVIAAMDKGEMLWQAPPVSETRVLEMTRMPILLSEKQDFIVWQKLPN